MRVPNRVLAAKCSDRWIGLRSPVTSAKPTTSDDEMVLDSRSVSPTERSSKYRVRSSRITNGSLGGGRTALALSPARGSVLIRVRLPTVVPGNRIARLELARSWTDRKDEEGSDEP